MVQTRFDARTHQGIILRKDGIETKHLRCSDPISAVRGQHIAVVGGVIDCDDLLGRVDTQEGVGAIHIDGADPQHDLHLEKKINFLLKI